MNRTRMLLATLVAALCASVPSRAASDPSAGEGQGRVVILGFDGADARTVRELMEKDPARYPSFRRLAESGTFAPLEVVVPAESPVSWASLNSGQNPAKTGVPGFIKRNITGKFVGPGFGFIEKKTVPFDQLEDRPAWAKSPGTTAGIAGGGAAAIVLLLALLLLRRPLPALILAVLAGGAAAFVGYEARLMLPKSYPRTANVNQVASFWDHAARAGVPCVVLDAAESFDAPTTPGAKVLHGLGLPDARNGVGDWFIYTTDPARNTRTGDQTTTAGGIFRVDEEGGVIRTNVYGPRNFWELEQAKAALEANTDPARKGALQDEVDRLSGTSKYTADLTAGRVPVEMVITLEDGRARVRIGSQVQTVAVGEWSKDFYELTFPLNWVVKIHALTRVRLVKVKPYFELLVNVLDIDPRQPPFWQPISSPPGFSAELATDCGLYETYGWPTLTMPFKDEKIEPELLLEDVEFTEHWREVLTQERLVKDDWRCLMSVFSTTDRVQHMLYQYYDTAHPKHDAATAARETTFFGERIKLSEAIPAIYRQMDRIIGDVLAKLRPEDTLMVISDHGFQTFRRQVHLNNWLLENGYLALKPQPLVTGRRGNTDFLAFVDWSKTRAYACGLGFIYLNLQDREPQGIVEREEWRGLVDEIRAKLLDARDPATGETFCSEVYVPRDIHTGPHLGLEAELIPGFRAGYRVGWSTSTGGLDTVGESGAIEPGPFCSDNDSNWSGDHLTMALPEVAGVFLSNRKVTIPPEGVRALQVAPTALALLGVAIPPEMDLPPLEVR